jgi:hypothetical protein
MMKWLTFFVVLLPVSAWSADSAVFDQFTDAFNAGLFQGGSISSDLTVESEADVNTAQGVNIISSYNFSGKVLQEALIEGNLAMSLLNGDQVVQGVNIYRGTAEEIYQVTVINGAAVIRSQGSKDGLQGINVITNCDSCSP